MTALLFGPTPPHWTDMSDYLVHFTKQTPDQTAYNAMMSILYNRRLEARSPFGFVREKAPDPETQKAVCFSETPLHLLGRLADHRSEFGIVFRKDYVLQNGGNPILYAYKDQPVNTRRYLITPALQLQGLPPHRVRQFQSEGDASLSVRAGATYPSSAELKDHFRALVAPDESPTQGVPVQSELSAKLTLAP